MERPDFDKLDQLISQRERAARKDQMGLIYVIWGLYVTLGMWVFTYVYPDPMFWLFWIPAGVLVQTIFVQIILQKQKRSIWNRMVTPWIWTFSLLAIPFLAFIFPFVLNLYAPQLIYPIVSVWIGMTMFAAGFLTKHLPVAMGAIVWIALAPLFLIFDESTIWIDTACNIFGLTIPGLWSMYDERR